MMRKLMLLFLSMAMFISALAAPAETVTEKEAAGLSAVGDVVEGFDVKEIRPFRMIGAELVLFEHQKTGAKLLYIANEDTNRAFQLAFPTRPSDNTGLPHVFEHSTLEGSEKYPNAGLWFNLNNQTYNTYMNASTEDAVTAYPIASLSEAQLLALADYYTDSCLHPLVLKDERIFRQEAWRYEMEDMDSPLTLNGTVYSEMTGAMTLSRRGMLNAYSATFPGSALTFDYGGTPESIPDMTWESLKEFHARYYHPSNCFAILYGYYKDYTAFLKLLDEAFSLYEKQDFSFTDSGYTRITEPVTASFPYPVAEGTDTENQAAVRYYIVCPGLREDKASQRVLDHALNLLNKNSSLLIQNLKTAFPSGSFYCGREPAAPDDAVLFRATNIQAEDAEAFRTVVNDSLKQVVLECFDPLQVDAIMAQQLLNDKLALDTDNPFEDILDNFAYYYALTGDPFEYAEYKESQVHVREENDNGLLTSAIDVWLVDPALYTLTTTYPEPGLQEKRDAALAEKLAGIKAGMTEEEKQAIIDATHAEPEENDNTEAVAALTAVTAAELPEEVRHYQVTDEVGKDGVRRMNAVAGVDGIGRATLYFDARALSQEDLHYLRLYSRVLGKMDTDAHKKAELSALTARYLMKGTIGLSCYDTPEKDDAHIYLYSRWTALDEDLSAGYDLMKELLFHTHFTDIQTLSGLISSQKASVRNSIRNNPYVALYSRQEGIGDPESRYYDYLTYTPYYEFLVELEQQIESDPEKVISRLQNVQAFLANCYGSVSTFAGNETSIALNAPLVDAFFADMVSEEREYPTHNLPEPPMKEAIAVDGNIQYNCIAASFSLIGAEPDYAFNVIGTLIEDQLLTPVLRDQMGPTASGAAWTRITRCISFPTGIPT